VVSDNGCANGDLAVTGLKLAVVSGNEEELRAAACERRRCMVDALWVQ